MKSKKILLFKLDSGIKALVLKNLKEEGYKVKEIKEIPRVIDLLTSNTASAIIIGYPLKTIDSQTIIKESKKANKNVSIIFIGVEDSKNVLFSLIKHPSVDFVRLPLNFSIFLARLEALLAKNLFIQPGNSLIKFKDVKVNQNKKQVTKGGAVVKLTPTEYSLLLFLIENQGKVCSNESLLQNVWEMPPESSSKVVNVYIGYLRSKLDSGKNKSLITTVKGFGYKIE
jgi:DNA-binding response OmpR family regulator